MRRKHTIRKIVLVFFILFVLSSPLFAGELYHCIDRNGNSIVTDSPQDGMKNCVLGDSWKDPSPEELAKKKKYIDKHNAIEEYNKKITEKNKEKFNKEYLEQQRESEEKRRKVDEELKKYSECAYSCSKSLSSCKSDCRHSSFSSCHKSCSESYNRCMYNNRCDEYLK